MFHSEPESGFSFFLDSGLLASEAPQVVETGTSDDATGDYFDMIDDGRMQRERPFNTDAV